MFRVDPLNSTSPSSGRVQLVGVVADRVTLARRAAVEHVEAPVPLPDVERREVDALPLRLRLQDRLRLERFLDLEADPQRGVVELELAIPAGAAVPGEDVDHVDQGAPGPGVEADARRAPSGVSAAAVAVGHRGLQVRREVRITETAALLIAVRGVEGRFCRAPPATMPAVDQGSRQRSLGIGSARHRDRLLALYGEQQAAGQPRLVLLRRRLRPQVVDLHGTGFEVEQLAVCTVEINAELAAAVDSGLQVDGVGLVAILDDGVVAGGLPRYGARLADTPPVIGSQTRARRRRSPRLRCEGSPAARRARAGQRLAAGT